MAWALHKGPERGCSRRISLISTVIHISFLQLSCVYELVDGVSAIYRGAPRTIPELPLQSSRVSTYAQQPNLVLAPVASCRASAPLSVKVRETTVQGLPLLHADSTIVGKIKKQPPPSSSNGVHLHSTLTLKEKKKDESRTQTKASQIYITMKLASVISLFTLALEVGAITCTPNTPPCSQLCKPNTDYLCCGASWVRYVRSACYLTPFRLPILSYHQDEVF